MICIEKEADGMAIDPDRLRQALLKIAKSSAMTEGIENILFHRSFPVDIRHNSKIFREKLALWAAKKLKTH